MSPETLQKIQEIGRRISYIMGLYHSSTNLTVRQEVKRLQLEVEFLIESLDADILESKR